MFSEALGLGSRMSVSHRCGRVDVGDVTLQGSEMRIVLTSRPRGSYKVTYVARGGNGSGPMRGRFSFAARRGPRCSRAGGHNHHPSEGSRPRERAAAPTGRSGASGGDLLVALGLAVAVGALGGLVLRTNPER